jgi:hypothetical protein
MDIENKPKNTQESFKKSNKDTIILGLGGALMGTYLLHDYLDKKLDPESIVAKDVRPDWLEFDYTNLIDGKIIFGYTMDLSENHPLSFEQISTLSMLDYYKDELDRYAIFDEFDKDHPLKVNVYSQSNNLPEILDQFIYIPGAAGFFAGEDNEINVANYEEVKRTRINSDGSEVRLPTTFEPVTAQEFYETLIHEAVHQKQADIDIDFLTNRPEYYFGEMAAQIAVKSTVDQFKDGKFDSSDVTGIFSDYDKYIQMVYYDLNKAGYTMNLSEFADMVVPASFERDSITTFANELRYLYPDNPNNMNIETMVIDSITDDYWSRPDNFRHEWEKFADTNPGSILD